MLFKTFNKNIIQSLDLRILYCMSGLNTKKDNSSTVLQVCTINTKNFAIKVLKHRTISGPGEHGI